MKIYTRSEFMKLPPGTIFSSGEPMAFTDLLIKGETWEVDFLQLNLIGIDAFNSGQLFERMDEMVKKGTSYPIDKSYGREGLFDDEMLYLVYEKEDLEYMIDQMKNATKLTVVDIS